MNPRIASCAAIALSPTGVGPLALRLAQEEESSTRCVTRSDHREAVFLFAKNVCYWPLADIRWCAAYVRFRMNIGQVVLRLIVMTITARSTFSLIVSSD